MEQKHMRDLTGRIADLSPEKRALLTMRLRKKRETTARLEGIPRRTELSSYPLSSAQERLWFLNQMEPESPSYNVPAAIRLKGHLDVPALERSLISIAERHEVLRASFPSVDGEPVQIVSPALDLKLEVQDISHLSGNEQTDEAAGRASAEARKPFDLSASPLLRTQLLRLQPDDHVLLLTVHHIVFDGWSTDIFLREISQGYEEAARGGPISLQSPTIQYADFAAWQRQWLDGEVLERQLGYWKKKLGGGSYHLDLPTDRPRPHVLGDRGARYSFTLSEDLSGELRALSTRNDATAFITLLAAFQLLLHRYASRDDIRVGAPVSNRTRAEIEGLVGFFVNTLVMKADFSADLTFRTLLNQVRETALAAYANQDIPFEKLVEELNPERDMSATPLFQVVFDLRQPPLNGLRLGGLEASLLEPEGAAAKFDMNLTMTEGPRGLTGDFQFNTDLFETETIARMATHYETLLRGIIADPDRPVSMIPMLSEAERNQIEAWNDTAAPIDYDRTLHELFDEQVERTPDAPALVFDGAEMTYAELQKRANQVAWYLMNRGVTRGSLVGVCIERSFEMIIGMLGILKAGGAYVPLDPSYPRDRLAVMIADSRLSVLLTQRDLLPELPVQNLHPVCLDSDWAEIARESKSGPDVTVDSKDLAYIIYTSGSTGTPKGTLMTHRGVCNLVPEWCRSFDVGVGSRVLQFFSAGFDGSVGEIFPTLLSGGALCLVSRQTVLSTQDLHKYMQDQRISTTIITPSYLSVLSHEELPDLGVVLAGGESCPRELAERWGADRRFYNLYGPTESTVVVCCHESDGDIGAAATVPVGRPIANIQFHILDAMFNPVPVGVPGELHIGGVALARGYLNRPDMTAERFIPDPFHAEAGVRMYRTGDLARYLSDGSVEILGRMDHQVKIRGFRVELGEIEAALRTHHEVQEVVVLVREDSPGIKRLTAYIVPDQDPGPSAGSLRDFLKERLPDYMVPSAYVVMDEFPLNSNEKVDRKSLPVPDMEAEEEERGVPRTPVEEMLAGIWSQVLGVEKVGINDNFFDLGGHSLLATQLTSRIRKAFGVELPLRTIFEYSTVAGVAGEVEKALRENRQIEVPPLQRVARSDEMPLSFAQQRLWFLDQFIPGSPLYNIVGAVRLAGPLDPEVLDRCLAEIIRRHESLRTVFHSVDGKAVQRILPPFNFAFRQFDHRTVPDTDREDLTIRLIREEACQPFELSEGPLVRGVLVQLDEQEHVAAFVMHHIISDGWSMSVLVRELGALYQAYSTGNEPSLPGLTVQYPDYTQWQRSWLQGKPLDSQLAYWKKTLEGLPPILDLPTDRPRPPVQTTSGARRQFRLPPELGDALKSLSVQEGTTLFMTLLGGFQILLMRYTENEDISVGTPIAGRNRAEIEDVIGLFVNTLVMRTDLSGEPTVREVLHRVRDVALEAYAHQDVPFEKVVDAVEPERDLSHTPLFQVMFALQNVPSEALNLPGLALRPMDVDIGVAIFDLTLTMVADEQGLRGSLEYNTDLFDDSTIERMVEHFRVTLEGMVADAEQRIPQLGLLSEAEGRRLLVDWNDTAAPFHHDGTLHELFDLQVEKTPNAQAVVCDNQELTYKQLQTRANQLAQFLLRLGVERGTLVGVLLERSVDMVVGLLAILKAGAAYVPLDPSYPPNRLEYILGDARAAILLTQSDVLSSVKAESVRTVLLDRELPDISRESNEPPQIGVTAEDLAYVIYTSGSTGTPKGVMISHRAALNLSAGLEQIVYADRARAELRLSLNAPISFDASVQQLVMLLHGHSLYIPPEEIRRDPDAFVSYIRTNRLDVLDCVPAQLKLLISGGLIDGTDWAPSVVLPGGEAIDGEMWKSLAEAPGTGFFNMYGPTECAVDSSICPVKG
ncbi:MAG: amino acid adenylation domain-containing protein, partial [Bacteroidota bacterium]